jgi:putative lysine/arginine/ornithine/histidine/octopine transport system substrate-binding protein
MQNYKKFLLAAAVSMAFSATAMAETLKMGIEAAYPPFNNKDASGNVVGFDKDIGDALCAKMKVEKCEVYVSDWDGIIPALNAKKFDFLVSSLSITDERKQAVDFTDPYYSNKLQFIAAKSIDFKTDADYLKGKIIGAPSARHWPVPTWKTNCQTPPPSSMTPRKTPTST